MDPVLESRRYDCALSHEIHEKAERILDQIFFLMGDLHGTLASHEKLAAAVQQREIPGQLIVLEQLR